MHVKYKTAKTCLQRDGKAPNFFSRCRQVPFHTGTWNSDPLDTRSRDCKRFPPKAVFRYAQGPVKTDCTVFFLFPISYVTKRAVKRMLPSCYHINTVLLLNTNRVTVRIAGCCTEWGWVGLFVSLQGMNAAHRTGKSANDVYVYIITICISHLD